MKDLKRDQILIVDDEADIRFVIRELILEVVPNCNVYEAINGKEALEIVKLNSNERSFDLVLSDINMPQMDGLTMLAHLRQSGSVVPVIIITAYGDKKKAIEALRLGAFDFLEKPLDHQKFSESVKKALKLGRELRNIETLLQLKCEELGLVGLEAENFKERKRLLISMSTLLSTNKKAG